MAANRPVPRPLFIVGEPRSGTTLLRNMVARHRSVQLTRYESHMIPFFLTTFGLEFPGAEAQEAVVRAFLGSQFVVKNVQSGSIAPTASDIARAYRDSRSWSEFFCATFAPFSDRKVEPRYWGDKTPAYLRSLRLLHQGFPDARILHIIRDPRDQVASEKVAWGKGVERAAYRWVTDIQTARQVARETRLPYHELTFESLLKDAERVIEGICSFLDLDPERDMLQPGRESDELGGSRGKVELDPTNTGKHVAVLSGREIRAVEQICAAVARDIWEDFPIAAPWSPSPIALRGWQVRDMLRLTRYNVRRRGLVAGLNYTRLMRRDQRAYES